MAECQQTTEREPRADAAEKVPETPPMPTGSGVFYSRSESLVERNGRVGEDSGPEATERRRLERAIKQKS
jgi:hypothetical protein